MPLSLRTPVWGPLSGVDADMGRAGALGPCAGPFAGVPFLGKDLGSAAKGLATAGGSAALRRRLSDPGQDSALFARFRAGGLVPFGLTTVPEFGLALTSDPARNPFDRRLSPGGSSGGAAAAVAGGIVAIAHATDAAGSIRVPAACCGLVGLKPSRGAVPGGPDFGNHLMGLASELVLARSVRDVATAFRLARGRRRAPVAIRCRWRFRSPLRVALCLPDRCGAAQQGAARAAAMALGTLGVRIEERPAPEAFGAAAGRLARMVLTASLAEWMAALGVADDELSPLAAAVAAEGRAMPATALFAASREMAQLSRAVWETVRPRRCAAVARSGRPACRLWGPLTCTQADPAAHFAQMEATAPNAALANVAGCPALVLALWHRCSGSAAGRAA